MPKNTGKTNTTTYRKPKRIFEDSGTVNPEEAYCVLLDNVTNRKKQDIKTMVDRSRYFSIFAPRQSGKTTFLESIRGELHMDPTYVVITLRFQNFKKLAKTQFYGLIKFTEEAVKKVYEETEGQPWLVNRLGTILTLDVKPETVESIEENDVETAIQALLKERNDHFDNLYEKAKLYKETFVEIVFDNVEYDPDDEDQTWLEQYGLIKNCDGHAVVANNIYKARYIKTFFKEVKGDKKVTSLAIGIGRV